MLELKGKPVADFIYHQITEKLQKWPELGYRKPHLCAVLVGSDPASRVYVQHKQKACEKIGFQSTLLSLPGDLSEDDLSQKIKNLNDDDRVDAILLQLPLPPHLDAKKISNLIQGDKDADALTSHSLGLLMTGQNRIASCTPSGIIEILKFYKLDIQSKNVLVVGRSLIVGLPLFHLLNQRNATVKLAHSKTEDLIDLVKNYDFVFVAVGKPHFLKVSDFKKNAVIIDVGIHRLPGGLIGDVDPEDAENHLKALTPVPGGVGPTTIACLMQNTYILAEQRRKLKAL